jgi:hypothetical protein
VLHNFGYEANGDRVVERRSDGTLVFFVSGYYEYRRIASDVKGADHAYDPQWETSP